jgi:hypothetical protein
MRKGFFRKNKPIRPAFCAHSWFDSFNKFKKVSKSLLPDEVTNNQGCSLKQEGAQRTASKMLFIMPTGS